MRLLWIIMLTSTIAHAQNITLKVWSDKIPGAKVSKTYQEQTVNNDVGRPRVSKVTDPDITIYLPEKSKANGTAVVICPGGGYGVLAIDHEGWDVAKWFNEMGVAGIVLRYRLPSDEIMENKNIGPLQDVQEAIRIVRRNAEKWNIKPDRIGVMGFSAGGHLAGTASTMYSEKVYDSKDNVSARPDFSILMYGVLSMQSDITHKGSQTNLLGKDAPQTLLDRFSNELHVDAKTPKAFLVHSIDDGAVPVENSIRYFQALKKNGVSGEMHIYEKGGHGYGLAINGGTESQWPEACKQWLLKNGLL